MSDGPYTQSVMDNRYIVVARHPEHEGVVSFDLRPPRSYPTPERALRHAEVHALHYFRDDEFEISPAIKVSVDAADAEIDCVVEDIVTDNRFHAPTAALRGAIK